MEITKLRAPFIRHKSDPLPRIIFTEDTDDGFYGNSSDQESDIDSNADFVSASLYSEENEVLLPEVTNSLPEVTYGLKPRMSWMYR